MLHTGLDITCMRKCGGGGGEYTRNYLLLSAAVTVTYGLDTANNYHFSAVRVTYQSVREVPCTVAATCDQF
jgi:hypothetical protein